MATYRLGRNGKAYRNTGSYASPSWSEMTNVRDVTLNLDTESADVATRADGLWGADAVVKLTASVDLEMIWDPTDAAFTALLTAFLAASTIEFLILDGAVGTTGSQGLRATCNISKFSRPEPLNEAMKAMVGIKPTRATNPPAWYTAA